MKERQRLVVMMCCVGGVCVFVCPRITLAPDDQWLMM